MASPVALADGFALPAAPADVRRMLEDIPGVIGCIPGASIGARNPDGTYPASIGVQYGETGMRFNGSVEVVAASPGELVVRATGQDGIGSVRASGEIRLSIGAAEAGATPVDLGAEFTFSGMLAPIARSATRIVGPQLLKSFGRCLVAKVAGEPATGVITPPD